MNASGHLLTVFFTPEFDTLVLICIPVENPHEESMHSLKFLTKHFFLEFSGIREETNICK